MWFQKKKELSSKEYEELKHLFQTLSIQVASLEADFTNLTNRVLKKIRSSRKPLNEEEEEQTKDIYNSVLLKE